MEEFDRGGSYFISQAGLTPSQAHFDKTEGNHRVVAGWVSSTRVEGKIYC